MGAVGRTDADRSGRALRRPRGTRAAGLVGIAWLMIAMLPAPAQTACSVVDHRPCAPTFCSVFDEGPCMPDIQYPFGQDLRLTVQARRPEADRPNPAARPLKTLQEVFAALRACWEPPPLDQARPGTEITVRFSLNRAGEILGEPHFTYSTPSLPADIKSAYQRAVADALKRCMPLALSKELGGAIAGRPISGRFIDDRGLRRTENAT
jgi:hypothetical protein